MSARPIVAALLAALVLAAGWGCQSKPGGGGTASRSAGGPSAAGGGDAPWPAPDFALQSTARDSVRLSGLRGKVVLVDFWATWCGPCKAELPHLSQLYRQYHSRGLEIVGIADDPAEHSDVAPFAAQQHIPYTIVYGEPQVGQSFGGVVGYPTLFVVDRKGQVVKKFIGYTDPRNIEQLVQQLL